MRELKALPSARYLRITEYPNKRVIEAYVIHQNQLPPPVEEEQEIGFVQKTLMLVSLFGWGFLGVFIGNIIFTNV
tara:strand:- start:1876 stop:2100 length:225 start_codon:yes stop_codon:yes gene_type:complete